MKARTLIAHGNSSLTVSLPSNWIKERHLKKGDDVFIEQAGKDLVISAQSKDIVTRTAKDISKLDRVTALHYIQSAYRFGYDEIEVKFDNTQIIQYPQNNKVSTPSLVTYIVGRMIGAEIIEQEHNKILIKRIIDESNADFLQVLRRIFILLSDTTKTFTEACETHNKEELANIKERHDRINNLTNYCLRVLNKNGFPDAKKTSLYYHTIANIDKIIDIYKYIAQDLLEYNTKLTPKTMKGLHMISDNVLLYCKMFYKFSQEDVHALNKTRWEIKKYIVAECKTADAVQIMHLTRAEAICEYLLDMVEARMALE